MYCVPNHEYICIYIDIPFKPGTVIKIKEIFAQQVFDSRLPHYSNITSTAQPETLEIEYLQVSIIQIVF